MDLQACISGVFVIFQVSILYVADCYGPYASSAQAGQSLARNLMGLMFPLFTQQMFASMTYKWGPDAHGAAMRVNGTNSMSPFLLWFKNSLSQ
ncbi:hypothetical protein BDR06DRAFT_950778 [Suillus hirtellus]|nr:hypothetical protein BDR06DRAFT_950778 [Suillus hirtellus]